MVPLTPATSGSMGRQAETRSASRAIQPATIDPQDPGRQDPPSMASTSSNTAGWMDTSITLVVGRNAIPTPRRFARAVSRKADRPAEGEGRPSPLLIPSSAPSWSDSHDSTHPSTSSVSMEMKLSNRRSSCRMCRTPCQRACCVPHGRRRPIEAAAAVDGTPNVRWRTRSGFPRDPRGACFRGRPRRWARPGARVTARRYVEQVPYPGPAELGRGVVVLPGSDPPDPWMSCQRVRVGDAELGHPGAVVGMLHQAWLERRPQVVELAADPNALRAPQRHDGPVHGLTPAFEFAVERLQFLVWANAYDSRGGAPIWWHGRKAARRFAAIGVAEEGAADIVLADGTPLYVDGGPPDPPALASGTGVVHRWSAEEGRLAPGADRPPAAELAPDQLAAVGHRSGAARVIAPAGSGKTRVLTERLRHLVGDRAAHPGTVSALAYNTRAADEMRQRCSD